MRRSFLRLLLLCVLAIGLAANALPVQAQSHTRAEIEVLAEYYARYYGVPITLVRRVINRESTFNPSARNGPYYGLMQILPETARQMGYSGPPQGLLDAETNLIYAVKYLRGAWLLAGGSESRAVQLYAAGYYYHARDAGMLEETGLRPGPRTIPTAQPVGVEVALAAIAPQAQSQPQGGGRTLLGMLGGGGGDAAATAPAAPVPVEAAAPAAATAIAVAEAVATPGEEPASPEAEQVPVVAVALGLLPPARPASLDATPLAADEEALAAEEETIVAQSAPAPASGRAAFGPPVTAALGLVPPSRPEQAGSSSEDGALAAIAAVSERETAPESDPTFLQLGVGLEWASAYAGLRPAYDLEAEADLLEATFALLDPMQAMILQSSLAAGEDGFLPPARPAGL